MQIKFNKPYFSGKEFDYMARAIKNGHISGDGIFSNKIRNFINKKFGTVDSLFVTSGTAALDMSAILIDLAYNDEVIIPSFTFVSTANAVVLRGAKPVFVDIEPNTLNIDPNEIEKNITEKTRAIYPVHYAGISCDMDSIMKIAKTYNLEVVEDAAQGLNSKYKYSYLGTIGDIGCYSFHETKNYQCGEGGAVLINDPKYIERAEIIREKGTNRSKFFRGEIDKYTWVDIGSSYIGSDLLAAFLWAQFQELDLIQEKRKKIFNFYYNNLKDLENEGKIRLPIIPKYAKPNYHLFYILCQNREKRNWLLHKLKSKGINAIFHYVPLHSSPMGQKYGYKSGDLPITEDVSSRLIRLPFHLYLNNKKLEYIVKTIRSLLKK
jgi:dTDP-4-amino-4,6-dideoxygalactose transaminase